ncbi:hypothetical protein H6F42_17485 [Pseudanabaena sp. FACHB-1998]|uniref:hypothetical protein n=1 Tax=Pseudanabaena sp. FACHB-1998 TaxID=2692858 RepID=UPI001681083B|nr:hypothetical protein [Pseudanabaena sp. FACHB-1998]MBD2178714.1 hypothetical protein [Pseudanabaena sp. FACHB-1998]
MTRDNLFVRGLKFFLLSVASIVLLPIIVIDSIRSLLATIARFLVVQTHSAIQKLLINAFFKQIFALVITAIASLSAMRPMLVGGYPSNHSFVFNTSWIFQYQQQFLAGQIYPRWLEFSYLGFGSPTFVFYPPMLAIATLPFSLSGMELSSSLIGSMVLAALTLGYGVYCYANLFFPLGISLLTSGLAIASPYFLLDIYQRGSLGEVWAIAIIPWILFFTQKLINQRHLPQMQRHHAISLACSWGLLGLSHLPTLLIMFLTWLIMPLCLVPFQSTKNYLLEVGRCYLSASLGFVGISFFLLPVILDQKLVQIQLVHLSAEYFPQNRLLLDGLLRFHPKLSTHWFESMSGMIPYFWIEIAIITLGAIALWRSARHEHTTPPELTPSEKEILAPSSQERSVLFWLIAVAIAILMTTDILSWIYQVLPILQKIQFSWRWYGLTVPILPLVWGYIIRQTWQLGNSIQLQAWQSILKSFLLFALLSTTAASYIYTNQIMFRGTGFDASRIENFSKNAQQIQKPHQISQSSEKSTHTWQNWSFPKELIIADAQEYLPVRVIPFANYSLEEDRPLAAWQSSDQENISTDKSTDIQIKRWQYGLREIAVNNQNSDRQSQYLILRMFYYSAWHSWIDGKPAKVERSSKQQAQIAVPAGQHSILVKYSGTAAERWGKLISYAGIILAISSLVRLRRTKLD